MASRPYFVYIAHSLFQKRGVLQAPNMVHTWEDYEKEMDKMQPGSSRRKEFQYPPILPIVYYEGTDRQMDGFH